MQIKQHHGFTTAQILTRNGFDLMTYCAVTGDAEHNLIDAFKLGMIEIEVRHQGHYIGAVLVDRDEGILTSTPGGTIALECGNVNNGYYIRNRRLMTMAEIMATIESVSGGHHKVTNALTGESAYIYS